MKVGASIPDVEDSTASSLAKLLLPSWSTLLFVIQRDLSSGVSKFLLKSFKLESCGPNHAAIDSQMGLSLCHLHRGGMFEKINKLLDIFDHIKNYINKCSFIILHMSLILCVYIYMYACVCLARL